MYFRERLANINQALRARGIFLFSSVEVSPETDIQDALVVGSEIKTGKKSRAKIKGLLSVGSKIDIDT